jgi:Lipoxygenase
MGALQAAGRLYEVDMRILASLEPTTALDGTVRFTPGTVTVLKQHPETKALTPIAIEVWTKGRLVHVYTGGDRAWLYALQAAKTSITVWGIWLGHVYHWHIVTAAMQMTMYNHLPKGHRLYSLLQPQSQSLIDFDFILLTHLWGQIAPPTPVADYMPLLRLLDRFAKDRTFFDDDPLSELTKRGLDAKDFTVVTEWDAYPVVGFLLDLWDVTGDYVTAVVDDLYASDDDVAQDKGLKAWMTASGDPHRGNVQGVPPHIQSRAELAKVLTSILYRVTVHGAGSLNPAVNPTLSFVANFPPCLQSAEIPEPRHAVSTERLLALLPHTGTIGGMTTFYYTFVYSKPYARLIPKGGIKSDPYFPRSQKQCNDALFTYRERIHAFVDEYVAEWSETLARIRGGATASPPAYAENQYGQWPRSIEI